MSLQAEILPLLISVKWDAGGWWSQHPRNHSQSDCHCPRQGPGLCFQEQGGDRKGAPGRGTSLAKARRLAGLRRTREEATEEAIEGKGGREGSQEAQGAVGPSLSLPQLWDITLSPKQWKP